MTSTNKFEIERFVGVGAPGVYEVSFEGVGNDRFLPIPPQRISVRAGEAVKVVVKLRRQ